jgi:hypothetical protein
VNNPVDSAPLITVLGLSPDNTKGLEYVDDIIDPSPLYAELPRALVQQEQIFLLLAVDA